MLNEYNEYTTTLYDVVERYDYTLFDFEYNLPSSVDKQSLELAFYKHYYFREIGAETIERWLIMLRYKWEELCLKYGPLFEIFNEQYLANDALTNNDLTNTYRQVFSDTPQSKLDNLEDYATNISESSSSTTGANGEYKFRLLSEYANKLRIITYEMIEDCEPLFMQLF